MSQGKNLSGLTGKKRTERSPRKLNESSTGTLSPEPTSDTKAGKSGDNMPKILIEQRQEPVMLQIVESKGDKLIARGEFGRCDEPTQNGRIYSRKLMEREIEKMGGALSGRKILGELDHPPDGKTSYKRVSHVLTKLYIDKDGIVMGEAEILNTREGKQLRALIEGKIPLGISSRGYGSTTPVSGKVEGEMVQDDFALKTYDFVPDPAVKTASPDIFTEDIDDMEAGKLFLAEFPDLAKEIMAEASEGILEESKVSDRIESAKDEARREMQEQFEKQLAATLLEAKEEISKELREEFSGDPEVGAAKAMLAQIAEMVSVFHQTPDEATVADALKSKDLEVAEAVGERDKAVKVAQMASWRLHVEREVKDHPMSETILKLVKVEDCNSIAEVKERLTVVMSDLPAPEPEPEDDDRISEQEASLRESVAKLEGDKTLLESKVDDLQAKLRKAVTLGERIDEQHSAATLRVEDAEAEAAKAIVDRDSALRQVTLAEEKLELEVYKHDKVVGLANGRQLLNLMEDLDSSEAVDRLVSKKGAKDVPDAELAEMRRNLSKGVSERQELTEDRGKKGGKPRVKDELGHDMDEMRHLSGIS